MKKEQVKQLSILECKQAVLKKELFLTNKNSLRYDLLVIELEVVEQRIKTLNSRKVTFKKAI